MRNHIFGALAALLVSGAITGCGGGSGSVEPSTPGPVTPSATALPAQLGIDGPAAADPNATATWRPVGLAEGPDLSYEWRFGDGGTASTREATHAWAAAGDYEVTLTVRNGAGASVTARGTTRIVRVMVDGLECTAGPGRGWCYQVPSSRPRELTDFAWGDNGLGLAVGEAGTVLTTTDAGRHWTLQPPSGGGRMANLQMFSDGQAWALNGGTLVHSRDAGHSWQPIGPAPGGQIWVVDAQRMVANATPAPSPTFWASSHSEDGGRSWQSGALMSLFGVSRSGVVMGWETSSPSALGFSHDLGRTVTSRIDCRLGGDCEVRAYTLADDPALVVLTVDKDYVLTRHRSSDGGRHWQSQPIPRPPGGDLVLAGGGHVFAYAHPGGNYFSEGLYHSADDGLTWERVAPGLWPKGAFLRPGTYALGGPAVWARVPGGATLSTDAGRTWRVVTVPAETEPAEALRRATDGRLLAGFGRPFGNGGPQPIQRWYSSADEGQNWTLLPGANFLDPYAQITDFAFASATRGVALYFDGSAATTDDGGRHWQRQPPTDAHLPVGRLRLAADGSGAMLLGRKRYATADGGRTWHPTRITIDPLTSLASSKAQFVDLEHGWVIDHFQSYDAGGAVPGTSRDVAVTTEDGGRTLREFTAPDHGPWLALSATVAIMKTSDRRRLRTDDAGLTWTPMAALDGMDASGMELPLASGERNLWWVVNSRLMSSSDAGRSWQAANAPPLPGYWLLDVYFADATHGWIACNAGLVLRTTDGGQSWYAQQLPSSNDVVRIVAADPSAAWALIRNGQLLATATAGE